MDASAASGRVGTTIVESMVYRLEHVREVAINIAVPESKHAKPFVCKTIVANRIARCMMLVVMLSSVQLDNNAMLHADKIDNEALARRLATEVKTTFSP